MNRTLPTQAQLVQALEKSILPGQRIAFTVDQHTFAFRLCSNTNEPITPLQFIGEHTYWTDVRMAHARFEHGLLIATFTIHKAHWTA